MNIFNHFQNLNLTKDQNQALEKLSVFLDSGDQVFILQGYAGSGKTTILKGIIDYLVEIKKAFEVMAPTGRAAKILREKTNHGKTIHSSIYNFEHLEAIQNTNDKDDQSFHYRFPIRDNQDNGKIVIVDESSMISSRESKNEFFTFGSDILLNDLLTYTRIPNSTNKIIFVGDSAQLPPVGDNQSKALMPEYFNEKGIGVIKSGMEEVLRQKDNNILYNATKIRSLIGNSNKNELNLDYDGNSFIKTNSEDIAREYSNKFPAPEIGQGVIIAYSNAQCLNYNRSVRQFIFPESESISSGDLLIINHNNYHTYGVELMNGEMAKVMAASQNIISRKNIPVFETINGKRIKKYITLHFRKVTLRVDSHSDEINCLIIDSLLNSPNRDLRISEMKALYIDFVMRFREEQDSLKKRGLSYYKVGSQQFKDRLRSDKYFNALRVKYGYAITCHKSQGGEWQTTFVDYYGRTSLKDDPLRWSYTATTRAVEKCYAANAPEVNCFSQFKINDIQPLSNIPNEALSLKNVPLSPYHKKEHHKTKSLKYWEIDKKLKDTPFQLISVSSLGQYQERYTIKFQDEQEDFDIYHNSAGIFKDFKAIHKNYKWNKDILEILNKSFKIIYNIDYEPTLEILKKLYGLIQSICSDLDITMTNISEHLDKYFIMYYLETNESFALIQFYINGKGKLTRALFKSTEGQEDEALNQLILKLKAHVV